MKLLKDFLRVFSSNKKPRWLLLSVYLVVSANPVYADDTEIYFSNVDSGGANIMMLIDTSGSMDWESSTSGNKKIDDLKVALTGLIDSLSPNARVGLARFNENSAGGRVIYPVSRLDDPISAGPVFSTIRSGRDDAHQRNGDGIDTNDSRLYLPNAGSDGGRVGFIFRELLIPRHAVVTKAYIEVEAYGSNGSDLYIDAFYEDEEAPQDYNSGPDLFSRNWKGGITTSVLNYWSHRNRYGIDVTDLVQKAVARPDWCGGNDLSVMLTNMTPGDTSTRAVIAYDNGGNTDPARLVVEWDPSAPLVITKNPAIDPVGYEAELACSGERIDIGEEKNDADEDTSGSSSGRVRVDGDDVRLDGDDYLVGLRFDGIDLETGGAQPDVIRKAVLHFRGKESPSSGGGGGGWGCGWWWWGGCPGGVGGGGSSGPAAGFNISIQATLGHANEFQEINSNISDRPRTGATVVYTPPGDYDEWHEVDVTNLVREAVSSGGWVPGGAVAMILESSDSNEMEIHSLETGSASSSYLELQISRSNPSKALPKVRDELKEVVNSLKANGGTPTMESYSEVARYLLGRDANYAPAYSDSVEYLTSARKKYKSPVSTSECFSTNIVMLTDGEPSSDSDYDSVTDLTGKNSCRGNTNDSEKRSYNCQIQLADWLTDDQRNGLGVPISTHTIGFDVPNSQLTRMQDVATAGNGLHRSASAASDLLNAFTEIIDSVTVKDSTMAAPGVSVNQLNRFRHFEELYYSVFKPSGNSRWAGNVKRYALRDGKIVDQKGNSAIDSATGFFKDGTSSWWADVEDGGDVLLGGTRTVHDPSKRTLFVSDSMPAPGTSLKATSSSLTPLIKYEAYDELDRADLGFDSSASDQQFEEGYLFLKNSWGDPLHSQPRLVNYGYTGTLEEAINDPSKQDNTVFVSTNDGILHAINPTNGEEYFAFIPEDQLRGTASRLYNPSLGPFKKRTTYGLDSSWVYWRQADTNGKAKSVYIYGGMRRGGRNYYALDVTDRTSPKLKWVIQGGVSNGFEDLGQTWSEPTLAKIMLDGDPVPVLIFGGGYSPDDHDQAGLVSTGDKYGNAVYIVNANNGALIWSASSSANAVEKVTDMKWSIPSPVSVVDIDFDGFVDHLYISDLGGQVFRVDVDNLNNTGVSSLVKRVETIAQLGTSDASGIVNHRRFYEAPTIALVHRDEKPVLQVVIGSGYRAHPLNKDTEDRFYVFDDAEGLNAFEASYSFGGSVRNSDLLDVTNDLSPDKEDFDGKSGWYISFSGMEKVLSSATVIQGAIFFTTFMEDNDMQDMCTSTSGTSRVYAVYLQDGSPAGDFNNDGEIDDTRGVDTGTKGIVGSPQIIRAPSSDGSGDGDGGGDGSGEASGSCDSNSGLVGIAGLFVFNAGGLKGCGIQRNRWFELEGKKAADELLEKHGAIIGQ